MNEVQVDVEQRGFALGGRDEVLVPDLFVECAAHLAQSHDGDSDGTRRGVVGDVVTNLVTEEGGAHG